MNDPTMPESGRKLRRLDFAQLMLDSPVGEITEGGPGFEKTAKQFGQRSIGSSVAYVKSDYAFSLVGSRLGPGQYFVVFRGEHSIVILCGLQDSLLYHLKAAHLSLDREHLQYLVDFDKDHGSADG